MVRQCARARHGEGQDGAWRLWQGISDEAAYDGRVALSEQGNTTFAWMVTVSVVASGVEVITKCTVDRSEPQWFVYECVTMWVTDRTKTVHTSIEITETKNKLF